MEIVKMKFKQGECNWLMGEVELCHESINELFDIPSNVNAIWLSFYNRSAGERVPVKIVGCSCCPNFPDFGYEVPIGDTMHHRDFGQWCFDFQKLGLMPWIEKTVYLQCEHE